MNENSSTTILQYNHDQICRSARECVDSGMVDPVVIIADARDTIGRQIAIGQGNLSDDQVEKMIREYAAKSTVPTLILAMPLESFRPICQELSGKALTIPPAPKGEFYACVIADERTKITVLPLPPHIKPSSN